MLCCLKAAPSDESNEPSAEDGSRTPLAGRRTMLLRQCGSWTGTRPMGNGCPTQYHHRPLGRQPNALKGVLSSRLTATILEHPWRSSDSLLARFFGLAMSGSSSTLSSAELRVVPLSLCLVDPRPLIRDRRASKQSFRRYGSSAAGGPPSERSREAFEHSLGVEVIARMSKGVSNGAADTAELRVQLEILGDPRGGHAILRESPMTSLCPLGVWPCLWVSGR